MTPDTTLSLAVAAIVAGLGMVTVGRRAGWGALLISLGLAVPLFDAIGGDALGGVNALVDDWWTNLPLLQQMLVVVFSMLISLVTLVLLALGLLRLLARPFIGQRAADALVAGLGVAVLLALFVGLFRLAFRPVARLIRRR